VKDHVTLKTGVMMINSALIKVHFTVVKYFCFLGGFQNSKALKILPIQLLTGSVFVVIFLVCVT